MNDIKTTKFKRSAILWVLWMMAGMAGLLFFMIKAYMASQANEMLSTLGFQLFFGALLGVSILALKDFKYVKVNPEQRKLTYYSILAPFGKNVEYNEFAGVIKPTEFTIKGEIATIHLVDHNMQTQFKLSETFYENFDEIVAAIELKEIKNYEYGFWKYFQLTLTGRLKIKNRKK